MRMVYRILLTLGGYLPPRAFLRPLYRAACSKNTAAYIPLYDRFLILKLKYEKKIFNIYDKNHPIG
jgi:hypothetical protein